MSPVDVVRLESKNTAVISPVQFTNIVFNNNPKANISHFKIIDQDSKQVAREGIHIRINDPALNCNTGKCTSQKSLTTFLEQMDLQMSLTHWETQTTHNVTFHLTVPRNRFARAVCLTN